MKRLIIACLALSLFVVMTGVSQRDVLAQDRTVLLRFSSPQAAGHELAKITEQWCKEVEKRTGGKIKVRHYAVNVLTSAPAIYDSIVQGVVDVGNHVLAYTAGKFPLSEVLDFPLGYPSGTVATRMINEYYNKFKPKEFDEVKVMYFHGHGPGLLHTKKPVYKMEDLRGMKVKTSGSNAKLMTNLGGVPVAMPMGDTYDALSRGAVEGLLSPYEALYGWKLAEVVKYTTECYGIGYSTVFVVAMNKAKWNSIPPEQQKIIEQINEEWAKKQGRLWDDLDQAGKDLSLKRGNKIIGLSAEEQERWAAKAVPLYDDYVKRMKEKGLPGEAVLKFARDYLKQQRR